MKPHTKIYLSYFPEPKCEGCGAYAQSMGQFVLDVHHIDNRSMGGSKEKDFIENLMGLCRKCHTHMGDKKQFKGWLYRVHKQKLEETGKAFDVELINSLIEKYAN